MDISGFTMLSEKLAKLGRVGAEEMADAIDGCFTELLAVAYDEHGSLLKFGGDAMLLLFAADADGAHHTERAARAAAGMRQRLRSVGKLETAGGRVNLRMSVGVHAGVFDVFLLGGSHRELVVTGPAASEVVRMESAAFAGEIVLSPAAAAKVPPRWIGDEKAPGYLLRSAPAVEPRPQAWVLPEVADDVLLASVPRAVRETIVAGAGEPEHRQVAVAFVHFDGTDRLLERAGPEGLAEELDALVRRVQDAADEFAVSFLGSDVDANGGKLDPGGRRAPGGRRGRGADAPGPAEDRGWLRRDPHPDRRASRGCLRRRHRPTLSAHVHRDGGHGEPRRPAHGKAHPRRDLRERARPRACRAPASRRSSSSRSR